MDYLVVYLVFALFLLSFLAACGLYAQNKRYSELEDIKDKSSTLYKIEKRELRGFILMATVFFFLGSIFFPITLLILLGYYLKNRMF